MLGAADTSEKHISYIIWHYIAARFPGMLSTRVQSMTEVDLQCQHDESLRRITGMGFGTGGELTHMGATFQGRPFREPGHI